MKTNRESLPGIEYDCMHAPPLLDNCRLIIEPQPQSGDWNMSLDEVLLETAIEQGVATLRWYRWDRPTISLGYFQPFAELTASPTLSALSAVRRLTGGGAIIHQHEWTYSLAVPAGQRIYRQPQDLYDRVHDAILAQLADFGLSVVPRGQTISLAHEPLLCFARSDAHDLVTNGHKVLGSAQRRRKGALLQHGSLVLHRAAAASQFPGLLDLHPGCEMPWENVKVLAERTLTSLSQEWGEVTWTAEQLAAAKNLVAEQQFRLHAR